MLYSQASGCPSSLRRSRRAWCPLSPHVTHPPTAGPQHGARPPQIVTKVTPGEATELAGIHVGDIMIRVPASPSHSISPTPCPSSPSRPFCAFGAHAATHEPSKVNSQPVMSKDDYFRATEALHTHYFTEWSQHHSMTPARGLTSTATPGCGRGRHCSDRAGAGRDVPRG